MPGVGTGRGGIVARMTENPRTPETPVTVPGDPAASAAAARTSPAPDPGATGTTPPYATPDQASWSAPAPAAVEPAPSAPAWRRFGRWVTAAVLVGVLLVGGVGGFAIGRATAPEVTGPFGGERPDGGRAPGAGSGELPEPPSDRSGRDSSDQGSADDSTTGTSTT